MHNVKKKKLSFRTMMERRWERGGKEERQEERSEGQIMSDGEGETILWAV